MSSTVPSWLKIAAAVVLLLVVFHYWPVVAGLAAAGVVFTLTLGGALAVGATLLLAVIAAVALAIVAGIVALGVSLAPLWLPVLAVIGFIAIVRSLGRRSA